MVRAMFNEPLRHPDRAEDEAVPVRGAAPAARAGGARNRRFLLLLGPCSPFHGRLSDALQARGHSTLKVLLHAGESLFWGRRPSLAYRGSLEAWPAYVEQLIAREGITDLVVHGESRDYHRLAIAAGRPRGLANLVFEMGYFRPDWITLERDGLSALSHFPRDPKLLRALAAAAPAPDFTVRYRTPFSRFARNDLLYHLGQVAGFPLYPRYRRYAVDHPLVEYAMWGVKLAAGGGAGRRAAAVVERLDAAGEPYFLLPLQLSGDFQIRSHSPFRDMPDALARVVASFAVHADPRARLVAKLHPLDNWLTPWRRIVADLARRHGLGDRLDLIDGGDLARLMAKAEGIVTVNSTAGIQALQAGRPTIALGAAVFDTPGLTAQDGLDRFWREPTPPDPGLVDAFVRALVHETQIRGDYYTEAGLAAAAEGAAARIDAGLPDLPERLERLRSETA
jgi:capsular polysaccharide export protein